MLRLPAWKILGRFAHRAGGISNAKAVATVDHTYLWKRTPTPATMTQLERRINSGNDLSGVARHAGEVAIAKAATATAGMGCFFISRFLIDKGNGY